MGTTQDYGSLSRALETPAVIGGDTNSVVSAQLIIASPQSHHLGAWGRSTACGGVVSDLVSQMSQSGIHKAPKYLSICLSVAHLLQTQHGAMCISVINIIPVA